MRLTLRYLLAYLDDQLEPADTQELSERIEASPFATDLMHRVHDVSRRLKLEAPKVFARGLAGDPNTVAEYLDHTMSNEQVTEFEKICLTSDMYLAEVASAHQILALVLGERAEVDPKLRRRMYAIPEQLEALPAKEEEREEQEGVTEEDAHEDELQTTGPRQRRPEIPEWLREKPKRHTPWIPLMITALLLVVGGAATMALLKLPGSGSADQQVATAEPEAAAPLLPPRPVAEASALPAETSALVEQPLERPADEGVMEPTPETPAENVEHAPPQWPTRPFPHRTRLPRLPRRPQRRAARACRQSAPAPRGGGRKRFETDVPATDAPRSASNDTGTFARNRAAGGPHGGRQSIPVGRLVNDSEVLSMATARGGLAAIEHPQCADGRGRIDCLANVPPRHRAQHRRRRSRTCWGARSCGSRRRMPTASLESTSSMARSWSRRLASRAPSSTCKSTIRFTWSLSATPMRPGHRRAALAA